jgi:hypothetical protein
MNKGTMQGIKLIIAFFKMAHGKTEKSKLKLT